MNNKIIGNKFENDVAKKLCFLGCWVSPFPGNNHTNSQPADLITCIDDVPALIDCKTLNNKNGLFPLNRIEENQRLCYKRWKECGNQDYYLVILWNNNVYFVSLDDIDFSKKSYDLKTEEPVWEDFYENNN